LTRLDEKEQLSKKSKKISKGKKKKLNIKNPAANGKSFLNQKTGLTL